MSTLTFDYVTYTLNSVDFTASVTGNALEGVTDVTIPPIISDDGVLYTVTSIGNSAFSSSFYLASIVIPETVTTIANGGGVSGTFSNCSALTAVTIGANVILIGSYAFQGCSKLTAVIIPDAVTSIGRDAFFQCSELTAVTIGSSVTSIGTTAFALCSKLTSMYFLGDLPSSLGSNLFMSDNSLTLYYLDGATGWSSTVGGRPAVAITAGTTGVASITAFSNSNKTATFSIANTSYTNVELVVLNGSSGVTSGKAFALSSDNWTVTSPALVDGDVVKVFLQTSSGATVTQLLSYKDSVSTVDGIMYYSVDLGVGIVSIGDSAFRSYTALIAVTIGANVTTIGQGAFQECSELTAVIIPDAVTTIGNSAFSNCSELTAVTIGSSVTSIGGYAFSTCSELTAVTIGSGLTTMGSYAFIGCTELTSMYFLGDYPSGINSDTFLGDESLILYYLDGATNWPTTVGGKNPVVITAGTTGVASITNFNNSAKTATFSIADNSYTNVELVGLNGSSGVGKAFALSGGNWTVTYPAGRGGVVKVFLQTSSGATVTQLLSSYSTVSAVDTYSYYSVDLGVGIVSIGDSAFRSYTALIAVTIGANVTTIGNSAFRECSALTHVTIGSSVTSIGGGAFNGCIALTAVTIPNAVTSIGDEAFYGCSALTDVMIGENVTSIGDYAFQGCSALTAVTISSGNTAFFNGSNGEVYQISGSTVALFFCPRNITSFTIPDSVTDNGSILYTVTSIASLAFFQCSALTAVTIGANVTSIGDGAFTGCIALTAVTIPNAVTSIGQSAFESCSALTAVTIGANVTTIGDYAFYDCYALTAVTIPDAVTSIGQDAFYLCSALTAVTIGSGLTTMGSGAFQYCGNTLTRMYFLGDYPSGIDGTTFSGDESLTLYYLDGATGWSTTYDYTTIGTPAQLITAGITGVASITAFSNSNKTATFSIADNSYTNVELVVLNGDSGVTSGKAFAKSVDGTGTNWTVTSPALVDGDVVKVFLQTSSGATVTQLLSYSYDSTSTYYSVDLGVGIVSIGNDAFLSCSELTAVTIGASVISIGDVAFKSCSALTAVIIPDAVTSIGISAFFQCSELTAVTIGASVTSIGTNAFFNCSELTAVIIPDAVTTIDSSAFRSCTALTAVTIGANVTTIGGYAFAGCSKLTAVIIPDAVTSIGDGAFQNCSALTSLPVSSNNNVLYNDPSDNGIIYKKEHGAASLYLSVPTKVSYEMLSTIQHVNVTSVHSYAFFYDASLSHIVLSDSITQIGEAAFQSCTGLSNVVIPANVTTIGIRAFVADSALASVYFLGDKPTTIGEYAFSSIKNPSTAYYLSSNAETWVTTPDGFTNLATFTISDLCVAGYTASELQTLGVADSDILGAGYSALDLKTAGYTIADLQGAGYSDNVILGAGYTATQLQGAGYTATQLQSAGYSATQLQSAGYSIADLQGAGYTDSAILGAGYSAAQLAAAGFYLISGTATGLSLGATFVLTLVINGDSVETKTIQATTSANNDFYFSNYVSSGSDYSVSATSSGKTATITNGSGIISTSNITDISIAFADNSTPTIPSSNVCFPAKTPILTNCGPINIEDIDPAVHTIRNKKIVAITKTVAHDKNLVRIAKHALGHLYPEKTTLISQNHKVFFQGQMVKAKHLVDQARGVTLVPYNGEILYNVLLEQYEKMQVNNLIVETLHPEHKVAKLYRFLQNVDVSHHGKLIALFNKKDKEHRIHLHL